MDYNTPRDLVVDPSGVLVASVSIDNPSEIEGVRRNDMASDFIITKHG
jgi:hypothetical protein